MAKRAPADPELIDLKLLRMLDLLYATRSVTRTAEELRQSQPTISIWLGALRKRLRDPLFVRTPEGMQPTPQADELIGAARQVLESVRRLSAWEPAFVPAAAERRFRVCLTDASHVTLLPQLLAHVHAAAPGVRLEIARIDAGTAKALQSGDADLAVGYIPWLESGIYQQTLYPQDWVCIASGTGHQLMDASISSRRIVRRVQLELPGFLGLGPILSTTDLLATLPRHIGETLARANGLRVLPCPFPIPSFKVKQHWHERYHHDPANRWLRGICATLFRQDTVRGGTAAPKRQTRAGKVAARRS
jgi:DNA-binding transcriptional LysR family regulator